jgi:hypothetical protein
MVLARATRSAREGDVIAETSMTGISENAGVKFSRSDLSRRLSAPVAWSPIVIAKLGREIEGMYVVYKFIGVE